MIKDDDYYWSCEICEKEFETKRECDEHEKSCKRKKEEKKAHIISKNDLITACRNLLLLVLYFLLFVLYIFPWLVLTLILLVLYLLNQWLKKREQNRQEAILALNRVNDEYRREYTRHLGDKEGPKEKRPYVHQLMEAVEAFNHRKYTEAKSLAGKAYNMLEGENRQRLQKLQQERHEEKHRRFEASQRAKGLVKYRNKWGTPEQVRRWREIEVGLNDNFAHMSPYEFEGFIAELFRRMGYDAQKTINTGDYGADVIAKKDGKTVLIQVKKYSHGSLVTPHEVQGTLGALWKYKADKAVLVTTSDFTTRAKDLENGAPIELWDKDILHRMVRKYFIERPAAR